MPDLTDNPDGYETIIVTTTGSKKLSATEIQLLNKSTIPNIDLSNTQATALPNNAFNGNKNLVTFKFPKVITSIGVHAFSGCSNLTGDLIIPDTVTSIGSYAFNGCSSLNGILRLPTSLTTLSGNAFLNCSGFTGDLIFPDGLTSIGANAFKGCSGFNGRLVLPKLLRTIGAQAFNGCSELTSELILPDSLESIGDYAFNGCSKLTGDLIIPDSVTSIGARAFTSCSGFNGKLKLSNSLNNIPSYAFSLCTGFVGELILPDSITSIGDYAFNRCSGLTGDLIIPNLVTSIGTKAFLNCSGFTGDLVISNSLTSLGDSSFEGMSNINKTFIKIDSSDFDTDYRKDIIDKLSNTSNTVIDIPYDLDISGTWLETTNKTLGKPTIKDIVSGSEVDLIDYKGELISLNIPALYKESNISILRDGKSYKLPSKNSEGKYIFKELGEYEITITTNLNNTSIIKFSIYNKEIEDVLEEVENAVITDLDDIQYVRRLVNSMPESSIKDELQARLSSIFPDITLEKLDSSANLDIYIKNENMLSLSLYTNSVTFDNYNGTEDVILPNAINLTVNSSLPYKLNASLESEIKNNDGSSTIDIPLFNIKISNDSVYKEFTGIKTPLTLLDNQAKDNHVTHSIDLKLKANQAHKADIYKTSIKFEIEQQ